MRIVTLREVIKGIPEEFRRCHGRSPDEIAMWWRDGQTTKGSILAKLQALDIETASADEVSSIIGNKGWASLTCDECGRERDQIVRLGSEPDYEERWQDLCSDCLAEAHRLALQSGAGE